MSRILSSEAPKTLLFTNRFSFSQTLSSHSRQVKYRTFCFITGQYLLIGTIHFRSTMRTIFKVICHRDFFGSMAIFTSYGNTIHSYCIRMPLTVCNFFYLISRMFINIFNYSFDIDILPPLTEWDSRY